MRRMLRSRLVQRTALAFSLFAICILAPSCTPSAASNVATYLLSERLGTLAVEPDLRTPGALTGSVAYRGAPVEGASVVVAERYGTPHAAYTDAQGHYRIDGIPPGQYVAAVVAPGYEETVPRDRLNIPRLVTIESGQVTEAPPIDLLLHQTEPLPSPLAETVQLQSTGIYTAAAPYPPGSVAQAQSFAFQRDGVVNDALRLYLPAQAHDGDTYPMLFIIYPGNVDEWEPVSVALAAPGYAVIAIAPSPAWGLDIDAHALDARIAFTLARIGALGAHFSDAQAVVMGGSFSSPVLHRFLRDEADNVAAWITLGGISDAFAGAADFYQGKMEVPPRYDLAIPALGLPNLYPLPFLRYSPAYSAAGLPPTMVIHTASDRITPIDQAYRLEAALRETGVPVEAYYYDDISHYLQIGDHMNDATKEMYHRVVDFIQQHAPARRKQSAVTTTTRRAHRKQRNCTRTPNVANLGQLDGVTRSTFGRKAR